MNDRWVDLSSTLIPVLLLSMMFHELAHGWAAYRMGDPTAKMRGAPEAEPLNIWIRWVRPCSSSPPVPAASSSAGPSPSPCPRTTSRIGREAWPSWERPGPLTNFILAIIFALILNWVTPDVDSRLFTVLFLLFQINVVLGIFNLIPIPPLDGSRVVGALLPRDLYEKWVAVDRYGMLLVIALIVLFQGSFFRILEGAMIGLAALLLTNYTI